MAQYQIAHIKEQGQDMIIIPLDSQFEYKSNADQQDTVAALQACASNAGLRGRVVVAWQVGQRHKFIAPPQWQSFFKSLPWSTIMASRNKTLTCG